MNIKSFRIFQIKQLIVLTFLLAITTCNTFAQNKNYVALSSAVFDIAQQDDPSYETRLEFRIGKVKFFGNPFVGVMMNTEGAMHIYLGLYYDIPVINRIAPFPT